ncbi:hypothetical protein ES703_76585 [subsurface metagenome]
MSKEKNTIDIIDGTLEAVKNIFTQFSDVLKTAKNELITLEKDKSLLSNDKQQLEGEKDQLEEEKIKLESVKNKLEQDKNQLEQDKKKLEEETKKLEKEKQERDQKIGTLTEEQMKLLDEYEKLKVELKKFVKIAEEQEEAEFNFDRIKALLSIYRVLLEEIWQGQPHFRILLTLHGDKEEMSREEIKTTTGISGAMVLRAIHELANVHLLEYDEDKGMVKLKKRMFEKKSII